MVGSGFLLAFAYACGSVPTGVWLSRMRGVDPRDIGSGNIGATNVTRAAGLTIGLLTLGGDMLKGLIPVLVASHAGHREPFLALAGLSAFAGHLFPFVLRFRGGKGVATALGVLAGLAPRAMIIVLPVFLLIVALSRYVSVASLATAALTPPLLFALGYGWATVAASLTMSVLMTLRHRDNIRRLRFGTEARIGRRRSSPFDPDRA